MGMIETIRARHRLSEELDACCNANTDGITSMSRWYQHDIGVLLSHIDKMGADNAAKEARIAELKAMSGTAIKEIYGFATCSICANVRECEDVDGRCEGRQYGDWCMDEDVDPHFEWRGSREETNHDG